MDWLTHRCALCGRVSHVRWVTYPSDGYGLTQPLVQVEGKPCKHCGCGGAVLPDRKPSTTGDSLRVVR